MNLFGSTSTENFRLSSAIVPDFLRGSLCSPKDPLLLYGLTATVAPLLEFGTKETLFLRELSAIEIDPYVILSALSRLG